jgi:hypothetical protein
VITQYQFGFIVITEAGQEYKKAFLGKEIPGHCAGIGLALIRISWQMVSQWGEHMWEHETHSGTGSQRGIQGLGLLL